MTIKYLDEKELENKIAILVGTRPGIIKMGPLIKELNKKNEKYFVIHAGQHYSYEMDKIFFKQLKLPEPNYTLNSVKFCKLHGEQTAEMLVGIEKLLIQEKPKIILVCGDANFNLAGALAARKLHINIGHVESGLRSNDWRMPEEHNRVIIDHISDYLFTPTEENKLNLIKDNVKGKIFVVGNTIVDAVHQNIEIAKNKSNILERCNLKSKEYFILTVHREENVDDKNTLRNILDGIKMVLKEYPDNIIAFPAHPRTIERLKLFNFFTELAINNLIIMNPIGYLDFLKLLYDTRLVMTDSGGIQEEACILKRPCVTLRENTERPETIKVGSNMLVGTNPKNILDGVGIMLNRKPNWTNPFGDGKTAKKIINVILNEVFKKYN